MTPAKRSWKRGEKYKRDKKRGILRKQREKRNHGFLSLGWLWRRLELAGGIHNGGSTCIYRLYKADQKGLCKNRDESLRNPKSQVPGRS